MVSITVRDDRPGAVIDKNVYGHFAEHLGRCIEEGIWVGEHSPIPNTRGIRSDVVAALRQIKTPVLRWPGGCFADEYHWKDGIGPRSSRVPMVNTHWGGVPETNQFGTHEYFDLCEQVGCEPYVNGNVGSGTVREMQEWVEYITHGGDSPMSQQRRANGRDEPWKLKYFGVGNENWGCGGNMRPEYYADEYRRFATYVRNFSGNQVFKIACGPNNDDYEWTETLMRQAGPHLHGLTLHYVIPTGDWKKKGGATGFDESLWFATLQKALLMDELVTKHGAIMDKYDPEKKTSLIVDEWGAWYDPEPGTDPGFLYQQNTVRDAVLAGLTLNVFNGHADRVRMANLAQTINVLQALILTDGPEMVLTPTFHVFDLYKAHQGATSLPVEVGGAGVYAHGAASIPQISASASRSDQGVVSLTFCNTHPREAIEIRCRLAGADSTRVTGTVVTGDAMDAHNTFDAPQRVGTAPLEVTADGGEVVATLPPMSVSLLQLTCD